MRTSKAASTKSFRSTEHPFCPLSSGTMDVESQPVGAEAAGSTCYTNMNPQTGSSHKEDHCMNVQRRSQGRRDLASTNLQSPKPASYTQDLPEQLAELIMNMIPGPEGEKLGDAFQSAAELPPITIQSLSELDVGNIITNIKLRHDVNFDRDLSFRPNLDGVKGHEKSKASKNYWAALVAELELYDRLFQGTPPLCNSAKWIETVRHAQRRIPKMFQTVREVLKSLVPDRDHSRVDEHLDVAKLMQEIERGVCDLVRLAEWMSHLLKEHCAPMRDDSVDKMVESIRTGVAGNDHRSIVQGLCELLGILETMKLDVANHQIRNLKTLLIENTVNFERHYHLDRLVTGRARVNIEAAHQWYETTGMRFRQLCMPQRDEARFRLDLFVRTVVTAMFGGHGHGNFPETFYLDHDRLRVLKAEFDDLVHFELCYDMFGQLVRGFGYIGSIPPAVQQDLRASLTAIMGEGLAYGSSSWLNNSEHVSLEIVRQASLLSSSSTTFDAEFLSRSNQHLRTMLLNRFSKQAYTLESHILPQVLSTVSKHIHSSPMELFNNLVAVPTPLSPPTHMFPTPLVNDTLSPLSEQHTDIANRIAHIILLHWRTWGSIAYVQEEKDSAMPLSVSEPAATTSPQPHARPPPPLPNSSADVQVLTVLKTGDSPDTGQETLHNEGSSSCS